MGKARQRQRPRTSPQTDRPEPPVVEAAVPVAAARTDWRLGVCAAILMVVTVVAFLPVLRADFIRWDDPDYVSENPLLLDVSGLKEIWTPFSRRLPQYYPLVFSSYWIEHQLWGLNPTGYHATNLALHVINVGLVLLLVRALGASLWVTVGAAAVFALHPVQVESVAWITERKNTLSGFFYLVAFLLYLRHRRTSTWWSYAASLLAFIGALLSKSETAPLPLLILFTDWFLQRCGSLRRVTLPALVARVAPMLAVAAGSALLTTGMERRVVSWFQLPTWQERAFIVPTAPWFYLRTFIAPLSLAPIVRKWEIEPANLQWWLGPLASTAALAACVYWGRRLLAASRFRMPVWGTVQFFISLVPVLGLIPFSYQHYSYVAVRFLYLPCIGGGVVLAALAEQRAGADPRATKRLAVAAVGIVILLACGVSTFREATHWHDGFTFWSYALERNPDAYPPAINLGLYYESKKEWAKALPFYQRAHVLKGTDAYALQHYLTALGLVHGSQAVIDVCDAEPKQDHPNAYIVYFFRAVNYEALGRRDAALADYKQVLALTRPGTWTWQQARSGRERLEQGARP